MTKRSLLTALLLLVGAAGTPGQTVSFRNTDAFTTPGDRLVRDWTAGPVVGTHVVAQLYYGVTAGSLVPVTGNPVRFRAVPSTDPLAGTWSGATRTLTGFTPGQIVTLQVRAWDSTSGATFETAQRRGQSATFTYRVPEPGDLPAAFFMEGFRGFTSSFSVPEPSGMALLAVGATALVVASRRKKRSP